MHGFRCFRGEWGEWGEERAARELNPANQKKSVNPNIQQLGFAGGHPPNY